MDEIILKAPAKINLTLDIEEKMDNGYHLLKMIMQTVDLYDFIKIKKTNTGKIEVLCDNANVPTDKSNIVHKACEEFFDDLEITCEGISIEIEKHIPMQAGLAGGSADAAAVIHGLNKLYDTNLDENDLCRIGVSVGADVPFALVGGTVFVTGIGETIQPISNLPECYFVIAKPAENVSTKEAFEKFDEVGSTLTPDSETMIAAIASGNLEEIGEYFCNVFEESVALPSVFKIKEIMRENDCLGCSMTGSGSAVYGMFENKLKAKKCKAELKELYEDVFITQPVPHGAVVK